MKRKIAVVTVGRSDYGILISLLRELQRDPRVELQLLVGGGHLSAEFGRTLQEIERDGFTPARCIETPTAADSPKSIAVTSSAGQVGFASAYEDLKPDLLVVVGDRFETLSAVTSALAFKIPVAHLHGGEITLGAFDDSIRHAITKLSHLHFASTQVYADRIAQMGEEAWRIFVAGAPALDHLNAAPRMSQAELEALIGIKFTAPPLIVTFHPVTLEFEKTDWYADQLVTALSSLEQPIVVISPNQDTYGRILLDRFKKFGAKHPNAVFVENLGPRAYLSLMAYSAAMIGNSSSGIVEAASLELPVVNVGSRQQGRVRAENVIDTAYEAADIMRGIRRVLSPDFKAGLRGMVNPYRREGSSKIIHDQLVSIPLDQKLILKRFVDIL